MSRVYLVKDLWWSFSKEAKPQRQLARLCYFLGDQKPSIPKLHHDFYPALLLPSLVRLQTPFIKLVRRSPRTMQWTFRRSWKTMGWTVLTVLIPRHFSFFFHLSCCNYWLYLPEKRSPVLISSSQSAITTQEIRHPSTITYDAECFSFFSFPSSTEYLSSISPCITMFISSSNRGNIIEIDVLVKMLGSTCFFSATSPLCISFWFDPV